MKTGTKAALLLAIWVLTAFLTERLPKAPVPWEGFFPLSQKPAERALWFDSQRQYLFADLPQKNAERLLDEGLIDAFFPRLQPESNLTLLLFERQRQNELLRHVRGRPAAGTVTVAGMLFENFLHAFARYTTLVVPALLLVGFLFFPLRYWLSLLLELSLYILLNITLLFLLQVPLGVASMLAGLFLVIYAMTLLNYMHLGEIGRKKLTLGIAVSLATTMISALYLAFSQFGLIAAFGRHLSLGLVILSLFLAARVAGLCHERLPPGRLDTLLAALRRLPLAPTLLALFILAALGLATGHGTLRTDLNPFALLGADASSRTKIAAFERRYLPALPVVVVFRWKRSVTFENVVRARKAQRVLERLRRAEALYPLVSPGRLFGTFAHKELKDADPAAWAQFLLALEFGDGPPLFSPDGRSLYATYLISLSTPSERIWRLQKTVAELDAETPEASITLTGRLADFDKIRQLFEKEGLAGFAVSFFFILLFFLLYCRTWRIVPVIAVSASLPVVFYLAFHMVTGSPLTLLSLIAMILYAGLYADAFIHLFVCYAKARDACLQTVLRPVVVSNLTMITALAAMGATGSLLGRFGLEMALLLSLHLATVTFLLPWLLKRYVRRCGSNLPVKEAANGTV